MFVDWYVTSFSPFRHRRRLDVLKNDNRVLSDTISSKVDFCEKIATMMAKHEFEFWRILYSEFLLLLLNIKHFFVHYLLLVINFRHTNLKLRLTINRFYYSTILQR